MKLEIPEQQLQRAIDNLVAQGKVERITMPDGSPGVRLVKKEESNANNQGT